MSSSIQFVIRTLGLPLATMRALAAATVAPAATTSVPATAALAPIEEVQELDEIWVRGKSLSDAIEDSEDAFFRLFNKLNKKNNFDVSCGYAHLDRNSLAMSRTCLPQFLANYSIPYIPPAATSMCMGGSGFGTMEMVANYASTAYDSYYHAGCSSSFGMSGSMSAGSAIILERDPAMTAQLRQQYMRNLLRVIYRDPRLLEKAADLAGLYAEMGSVQGQFRKVKAEDDARKQAQRLERREKRRL